MAFFWPKDPTDLERVEDKDLSNGTQVLVSYPESSMSLDIPFDSDLGREISDYYNNVLYPDMLKAKGASITVSVPRSKIPTPYVLVLGYNGNPNDSRIAEAARNGSGVAKLNTYVLYTELMEFQ